MRLKLDKAHRHYLHAKHEAAKSPLICPRDTQELILDISLKSSTRSLIDPDIQPNLALSSISISPSAKPIIHVIYASLLTLPQLVASLSGLCGILFGISFVSVYLSGRRLLSRLIGKMLRHPTKPKPNVTVHVMNQMNSVTQNNSIQMLQSVGRNHSIDEVTVRTISDNGSSVQNGSLLRQQQTRRVRA